ncbi:helix-turn-helix domain-containing protein [Neorhizobium sp. NPDC001467]|uniref:helix-turn-helix domain-containing protein n=1 Tax=Neorhizobium sp. NPDC001467 TaxID=3390595 RepID=UPI003D08D0A8
MTKIDSDWFYARLKEIGSSGSELAKFLKLDPSSVSRMLKGERKMSAEEQDGVAEYLKVSPLEIAARRRGGAAGFAEDNQSSYDSALKASDTAVDLDNRNAGQDGLNLEASNFYDRVRGCMKGTVTILPGVDLTAPFDADWAASYES